MKSRFFLVFFTLVASVAMMAADKIPLSLEDAKRIALEQNPTLARAQANIEAARASVDIAQSAYYPTLDLEAGITRNRDRAVGREVRDYDQNTEYNAGLSASWLVFDGFARRFRYLVSELNGDIAIQDCDDARRILLEDVAYAYYNVLQAQNTMFICEQDAEFNRQLKDDAQKKKDYGTAKLSEVLNFEFQVQTAEANYIAAKHSWRAACVSLGTLLNIQQDDIWDCLELVTPPEETAQKDYPSASEIIDHAWQNRPDLIAARQRVEQAELLVKSAKSDWLPTISAFGNYGYDRTHSAHFNKHGERNASIGLVARLNLFNGMATTASINQAKADLIVAQKTLEAIEDSVEAEIRADRVALESAAEILEKENSLLEVAKQIRDLVYEEYLGGTATITRVNEVQTDLTNTSLARSNAWIAVLNAIETLSASTGSILK